jgi:altronate hydrolase
MDRAAPPLPPCYRISARDDVAIALRDLAAGEAVVLDTLTIELLDAIPRGHKFALRSVSAGESIRKYG